MADIIYPVDHLSYSALKEFLRNRFSFKRKYILKIYGDKTSPAAVVGKAVHKALEVILKGGTVAEGTQAGLEVIERTRPEEVNWGKTGSIEDVRKTYAQTLGFYLAEMPKWNVVAVEKKITTFIEVNGAKMAIPAKAVVDLIVRNDAGKLDLVDHKTVSSFTSEEEKGDLMLQAMFCYHTVRAEYGEAPERMIYRECKTSKNKEAGAPQCQEYVIVFDEHPDYFSLFATIYDAVTVELSKPDCMFLPNLSDRMDAVETFKNWSAQQTAIERPVMVQHKNIDRKFAEKEFVPSATDIVDNEHLIPEEKVRVKLQEFGVAVEMRQTFTGPNVTLFTMKPSRGIRMTEFERYGKDIAIALKAKTVRIEAPIPGTDLVGIECSRDDRTFVAFDPKMEGLKPGTLNIPIGQNVHGKTVIKSLADMPHLLIAGATGSGKSVAINVTIKALMAQNDPRDLKFVMVDFKRVELAAYKNEPHLLAAPIYETPATIKALAWLVDTMEARYNRLETVGAKNIEEYNEMNVPEPRIVVVIDEFGDLMLTDKSGLAEDYIVRLAQKARAVGIHLILGIQRPSTEIISGIIKANFVTRIAFRTASAVDSRVILDQEGAEQLGGKGDLLFMDQSVSGLQRLQGFYC